jgi:hypothetical protein
VVAQNKCRAQQEQYLTCQKPAPAFSDVSGFDRVLHVTSTE